MIGGVALLERAVSYTLGCLTLVGDDSLDRPTPCAEWDVRGLLMHISDSLGALTDAADVGSVDLVPPDIDDPAAGLVALVRERGCRLLGTWSRADGPPFVSIAGRPLSRTIVAAAGALEIAAHGWDLARACGHHRPIPPHLAVELLSLAPLVITDRDRPGRFAPPVEVPPFAPAADQLIGFLGRGP